MPDLVDHPQHLLVRAAVQRTVERRDARRDGRERIDVRRADGAHRVRRAILLVVGVEDEQNLERLHEHRIRLVLRLRHPRDHREEILDVAQIVVGIDERQTLDVAIAERRERRQLREQTDDRDVRATPDRGCSSLPDRTTTAPRPRDVLLRAADLTAARPPRPSLTQTPARPSSMKEPVMTTSPRTTVRTWTRRLLGTTLMIGLGLATLAGVVFAGATDTSRSTNQPVPASAMHTSSASIRYAEPGRAASLHRHGAGSKTGRRVRRRRRAALSPATCSRRTTSSRARPRSPPTSSPTPPPRPASKARRRSFRRTRTPMSTPTPP